MPLVPESGSNPYAVRSITDQVAHAVRHKIRDEGLLPGHRLGREQDLAQEFGVSKPTMREALQLLSAVGLIRSSRGPGGGVIVERTFEETLSHSLSDRIATMLDINATTLGDLLDARLAVELPIVRLAAVRIDDATIAILHGTVDEIAADPRSSISADGRFHRTIAEATHNRMLRATIDWAFQVLQPRVYEAVPPEAMRGVLVAQHRAIVDALASRSPDAAAHAMQNHIEHVRTLLDRHLAPVHTR